MFDRVRSSGLCGLYLEALTLPVEAVEFSRASPGWVRRRVECPLLQPSQLAIVALDHDTRGAALDRFLSAQVGEVRLDLFCHVAEIPVCLDHRHRRLVPILDRSPFPHRSV